MRRSYKLLILLAVLALTSLSCKAVTRLVDDTSGDDPAAPTQTYQHQGGGGELLFVPDQLPQAQLGEDYSAQIEVQNTRTPVGAFDLAGELPPGLELNKLGREENKAEISGTPTQAGTYTFTVHVWCYGTQVSGQTGEQEYTIVVK